MRAYFILTRAALAVALSLPLVHGALAQAPAKPPAPKAAAEPTEASGADVNNSPMNGEMFLQLLGAELNMRRGDRTLGFQMMLDAARRTQDEGIYRRALQLAYELKDGAGALATVKGWRASAPKSIQAAREEVEVLLQMGQFPEAAEAARSMLELTPVAERAPTFVFLPRLFQRVKDPRVAVTLLEPVLKPWMEAPATRTSATTALARLVSAAGDYPRATELAARAHAHEPTAELPALVALDLMKNSDKAEAVVLSHLKAKPQGSTVQPLYASLLASAAQRRYAEALVQYEALVAAQPDSAANWLTVAALQLELKQPDAASTTAKKYLAGLRDGTIVPVMPSAPAVRADADDEDGEEDTSTASTVEEGSTQAYFLLSRASAQKRDFAAAEQWLARVTDPSRALDVAGRRAQLLADQGKLKQAVDVVRKAPATDVAGERLKVVLEAQLYNDAKQWDAAEKALAAGVKRFPKDEELMYQQAMAAEKLNRVEEMERLLRRVIELRADHYHAYNALGYSLADRNLRLPEAKALIVKALELSPAEPLIIDSLGWVEFRLGNLPEAKRLLRDAWRQRPEAEIGAHLGEVLWVSGDRDEALRVLRAVRELDRDSDVLKQTLARLKVDL